jgi:exosortase
MTSTGVNLEVRLPLQRWLAPSVAAGLVAALYSGTVPGLVLDWWTRPDFSHGLLIPPLALYLAWLRREEVLAAPAAEDSRGLLVVLAACVAFLAGKAGAEFFLTRVSLVILLAGLLWTFWGLERLKRLGFPLVLLATMVPVPAIVFNLLAAPLQLLASEAATRTLQGLGLAVYRDGNIIHLPEISLGVAEACSGLRSLVSLLVMALLVGYWRCRRPAARALLVLAAVPVAVGANVARIAATGLLADHNPQVAMGFYHYFSGWLLFLGGLGVLLLVSSAVRRL